MFSLISRKYPSRCRRGDTTLQRSYFCQGAGFLFTTTVVSTVAEVRNPRAWSDSAALESPEPSKILFLQVHAQPMKLIRMIQILLKGTELSQAVPTCTDTEVENSSALPSFPLNGTALPSFPFRPVSRVLVL